MKIKLKDSKVKNLEDEIIKLKLEIESLKKFIREKENRSVINFKKEIMQLDRQFLLDVLKYNDHRTEKKIFKQYYKEGDKCSVRVISARKIMYYTDDHWKEDMDGCLMIEIFCHNIQRALLSVNRRENFTTSEEFINNQIYINKFTNKKYHRQVYKEIRTLINIT